jgi:Protein of unknown function (DUF3089)
MLAGASVGAMSLVGASSSAAEAASAAEASPASQAVTASSTVWLCRPGTAIDPCAYSPAATAVEAGGAQYRATLAGLPPAATASKFDCFYVYPTVSDEATGNASLAVQKVELVTAVSQVSPFSQVCNVWAPMYRQQTWSSVQKGLSGDEKVMRSTFMVAYNSLLSAWEDFLAHDDQGRPIILIGDSQGSAILIHLISTRLDYEPSVLRSLLVAIIAGGNLQVPTGKTLGATFTHVPLCSSSSQTGCAIAYSSYPSEPPANSLFGRPGQGVSLQSGQLASAGQQVACVNPAALSGGTAALTPYFLAPTQTTFNPPVSTPWVTYPDLYTATCESKGGATWLQVNSVGRSGDNRPVISEAPLGPAWGYHGYDVPLALGNLVQDVAREEAAWATAR